MAYPLFQGFLNKADKKSTPDTTKDTSIKSGFIEEVTDP